MLASAVVAALSFNAPLTGVPQRTNGAAMSVSRRDLVQGAGAAFALLPAFAAQADGANSRETMIRARAIYGSRVFRLQDASPADVLAEKNTFQLFATGVYRNQDQKDTKKQLLAIQKKVVAAAEKGDAAATSAAIKEFVAVGNIKDLTANPETTFDPKARRNAGAPKTSEILAQMGSEAYAFTTPLPPSSKK